MARLQYQPATKPRGFQPIQLSRAGIARMEEEGNRVIRNLEKERDATIRQRQENLQAMKENAAYEQRAQDKNQEILQTNLKTERLNIEAEQKAKRQQADARSKAVESAVTGLVNFSVTFAKQAAERTKQMITDQVAEGAQFARQEYLASPKRQNDYAAVEGQIDVNIEKLDQANFIAGQAGLDSSLETAKSLAANPGRGYYWKKGYYNEFIKQQTPMLVDRVLQSTEELFVDENGKKFSGIEAVTDPDKMRIVLSKVQNGLYGATGLDINSLEPGFLEDSSKFVVDYSSTRIQQAANKATNIAYDNLAEEGRSHIAQGRVGMGYRLLLKNPKIGREGALKEVFALYSAQNADGTFRYSVDELDNIKLLGDKTIFEERGNSQRYQDAIAARRKAKTDFLRDDQARVRIEAREFDNQTYNQLAALLQAEKDPSKDLEILATYMRRRAELYNNEALSDKIVRLKKSVLAGNLLDETTKLNQQIRLKTLSPEYIEGIKNPKLQLDAIKALTEQETAKYGPKFNEMKNSLLAEAKILTQFDPTVKGPGSGTTIMVNNALKSSYEYFFKALVDKGVPVHIAADQAYGQLKDYIAKGATDKTNKFYTETGALNKPTFPNIEGTAQSLTATAEARRNELDKLILKNNANVGSIFSIPNAVLSETQIETTINSYYANNGTFKIPVNIQYAAKVAGVNPIAAINAQIQASNEKHGTNKKLITASPAEEAIFDQVPSVQKLFTDYENRSQARISRGISYTTRNPGPVRASMTPLSTDPPSSGGLSMSQVGQYALEAGFTPEDARVVAAIARGESGLDPTNSTRRSGLEASTGEDSVGLMQINWGYHKDSGWLQKLGINSREDLFDPVLNMKAAKYLYDNRGSFDDWTVYTKGIYKQYLN
jgi:hypothetical protein